MFALPMAVLGMPVSVWIFSDKAQGHVVGINHIQQLNFTTNLQTTGHSLWYGFIKILIGE